MGKERTRKEWEKRGEGEGGRAELEKGDVSEESRQHQEDLIKAGEDTGALVMGRTAMGTEPQNWARKIISNIGQLNEVVRAVKINSGGKVIHFFI